MVNNQQYDFIIVGNGLSGLQLALEFSKRSFFDNKQIALIDKDEKTTNDKTWSFWEKGDGKWDAIIEKSWQQASIFAENQRLTLDLKPYTYKSIHSLAFYTHAKERLRRHENIHFIIDEIEAIDEGQDLKVIGKGQAYSAGHVFDSRIPEAYFDDHQFTKIIQHFKGIVIETPTEVFNQTKVKGK